MKNPNRGRVYRRCACRGADGRQLGARCPKLANRKHGTWTYAVDLPALDSKRRTRRRSGFATKTDAQVALSKVLEYERTGIVIDDRQTVADYLASWLRTKALTLKPTTMANYHAYVHKDLIPHIGLIRLEDLSHQHVVLYVRNQLEAGRGHTTLRRCLATLSSALGDAVRQHRLPYNAARYVSVTRPTKYEPVCWSPVEASQFLKYCADHDEPLTNLFELIIGTGMRKGEALALHWTDVHLDEHVLFVRQTLSNVNNSTPVFTTPKTKSSLAWVGLSNRVTAALQNQAERQPDRALVFTRRGGQPLRPEYVLHRFHKLTEQAGLPRIRVHDLRHFAATTMLSSQVPLAMASKTLRHSTLSTTTEIYGHLLRQVALDAVKAIETALKEAEAA